MIKLKNLNFRWLKTKNNCLKVEDKLSTYNTESNLLEIRSKLMQIKEQERDESLLEEIDKSIRWIEYALLRIESANEGYMMEIDKHG